MCVQEIRDFDTLVHKCPMFDDTGRTRANYYKAQHDKKGKSHGFGKPYNKDKGKKNEVGGGSKPSLANVKCFKCGTFEITAAHDSITSSQTFKLRCFHKLHNNITICFARTVERFCRSKK